MDIFQVLEFNRACGGIGSVVAFIKNGIYPIIQIGIPIILIIMGSIDLGRAVLSSDDKEIKAATGKLIKRAIAAVAVFFVSTIVSLLMGMFQGNETDAGNGLDWSKCWAHPTVSSSSSNKD